MGFAETADYFQRRANQAREPDERKRKRLRELRASMRGWRASHPIFRPAIKAARVERDQRRRGGHFAATVGMAFGKLRRWRISKAWRSKRRADSKGKRSGMKRRRCSLRAPERWRGPPRYTTS